MTHTEYIYGLNPAFELLRAGKRPCHELLLLSGKKEKAIEGICEEARRRHISIKNTTREELTSLCLTDKHQGVAVKCDKYPYAVLEEVLEASLKAQHKGFLLVLDCIEDPQNLGSLVRTAHLMGVHGVIIPRDNAAAVTPAVVKASAGASEYMSIVVVTNIANTLNYIKKQGFWVIGAEGARGNNLYLHDFKGYNLALVMGSEGSGIRRLVCDKCDFLLSIPMTGMVGSFNVSVAGALFMGEVARQRLLQNQVS